MEFLRSRSTRGRLRRLAVGSVIAPAVLASVVATAQAQVEVPTRAASPTPAPPSGSAAPAPEPGQRNSAGTTAPATATTAVRLRIGSRGAAVRELQRAVRARGLRYVTVDGSFGPQTRRAVIALQVRFKMARTGVAEGALLRRLGLRTRTAASATTGASTTKTAYLSVFPVLGEYSYFDDYGAPRHQGAHQGTDLMADKGTPLVAVVDGTIKRVQRTESGLGGVYIWLQRADGTEYYYAHMDSIGADIQVGTKVTAGQIVGTVGNTGDARYGAHHLHFEIRLAGNRIINPYTHLVAVDPARKSSAARSR